LKRKDGPSFSGVFEEGELCDNIGGVITYPDGSKYEGIPNLSFFHNFLKD